MMNLYPLYLKVDNTPCCVIGGGLVALRKVKSLLRSKANITVISPKLCSGMRKLKEKKLIKHQESVYQNFFLKGFFLVIAATDNQLVNRKIFQEAIKLNLLVNVVDSPDECNFYVPSVLRKNGILMSISTQGAFPAMAKRIKKECEPVFQKYAKHFRLLAKLRREIYKSDDSCRMKKMLAKSLLKPDVLAMIKNRDVFSIDGLRAYLSIDK